MLGWRTGGDLFFQISISVDHRQSICHPELVSAAFARTGSLDDTPVWRRVYWSALHQGLEWANFHHVHVPAIRLLGVPVPKGRLKRCGLCPIVPLRCLLARGMARAQGNSNLSTWASKVSASCLLQSVTAMRSRYDWCAGDKVGWRAYLI